MRPGPAGPRWAGRAGRLRTELIGLGLLALASVLYKVVLLGTDLVSPTPNGPEPALVALPGYLDQFAVGMALAVVSAARPDLVARRAWPWLALAAGAFALSTVDGILGPPASFSDTGYLMRDLLYGVIALGLLVPAAFPGEGRGAVRRVLANPVLRWLGLLSYGIYLYHLAVLVQLSRWGLKDHGRSTTCSPGSSSRPPGPSSSLRSAGTRSSAPPSGSVRSCRPGRTARAGALVRAL